MARAAVAETLNLFSASAMIKHWNTQIKQAANAGDPHKALHLYRQMRRNSVEPNNFTFPFVAKACAHLSDLTQSQMIHSHIIKSPFWCDVYVGAALVDSYVKCGNLGFARNLFDEMPERDVASWNVILLGLVQKGFVNGFFEIFGNMRWEGVSLDSVTVIGLIQSVIELLDLNLVRAVHSIAVRLGMTSDVSVANTEISAYSKCGDFVSAEDVFAQIDSGCRTVVSWNSLLAGYARSGDNGETINIYKRMLSDGFRPDVSSFVSILSSYVQPDCLAHGMLIHAHMIQLACDIDICAVNTMIAMYSKCGVVNSARQLFETMSSRTCVSWTVMIDGYVRKGNIDEAWGLFMSMEEAGEKPDEVTLISLISGCGQAGSLELGCWINQCALSNGFGDDVILCNALIDMYAKCGCIGEARRLFQSMPQKTEVSWTTMITGCALNGEFLEALSLFSKMVELKLKPNHITFLSVLQACTHAGFLEKGWEYFNLMKDVYDISPKLEHYSSMVDLLGRRGKVKEALELIKTMEARPDAGIWGALLNACKVHCNIEIGEYAAYNLFELEPESAASYVEMANTYASEARWDGVSKVRALMKGNGVRKFPGQSSLEINGSYHRFSVEESSHPECPRIYKALSVLILHLKEKVFSLYSDGLLEPDIRIQSLV